MTGVPAPRKVAGRLHSPSRPMFFDDATPTSNRLFSWIFRTAKSPQTAAPERASAARAPSASQVLARIPLRRVAAPVIRPAASSSSSASAAAREGDLRRAPRASLDVAGGVTRPDSPAIFPARTVDVSKGGALVFTLADLPQGKRVTHLLRFQGDHAPSPIVARVAWRRRAGRGHEVGLCYDGELGIAGTRLATWIDERFADVRQLQFLLALGRRSPVQDRDVRMIAGRLGAPIEDPVALRSWLAHAAAAFRHSR